METVECIFPYINQLPKAELHCHFDGSLRLASMLEEAKKQTQQHDEEVEEDPENPLYVQKQISVLTKDEIKELVQPPMGGDLIQYLQAFRYTLSVLQIKEAIHRLYLDLVEDLSDDGVIYAEIRFDPQLHTHLGLSLSEVLATMCSAAADGYEEHGVTTKIIVSALKNQSATYVTEVAQIGVEYSDSGVVAFDLCGPEESKATSRFSTAVELALEGGLHFTCHAGEVLGPDEMRDAMQYATRIGHGTHAIEDPDLVVELVENDICLEQCITSNIHTNCVASLDEHPIVNFIEAGVPIALSTDNRLVSDCTLSSEYELLIELLGKDFPLSTFVLLLLQPFKHGFASTAELVDVIERFFMHLFSFLHGIGVDIAVLSCEILLQEDAHEFKEIICTTVLDIVREASSSSESE
ncbi:hypothetical protein PCE1_003394 [Barthelona sp. PCE]